MPDFIHQLRSRLLELGCPLNRLQRLVREVADHREDLIQAALAKGLPAAEAKARAEASLGNPESLAEDLMVSVRQSSWCGRHRFITFALVPLLAYPVLWGVVLCSTMVLGLKLGLAWNEKKFHAAAENPVIFHYASLAFHGLDYAVIALVVLLFCLLAGRSAAGRRWLLFACVICAVYSLFIHPRVSPHALTVGLTWKPQWIRAVIPLLTLGIVHLNRLRVVRNALKYAAA